MTMLPSSRELALQAGQKIADSRNSEKIYHLYAAIVLGMAAVVAVLQYLLDGQISQTSGLSNLQARAVLSTLSEILSIVQTVVSMCLGLGLCAVSLRVSRGQPVTASSLRAGFERIWPLLKCTILKALILFGGAIGCFYLSMTVFLFSPFSNGLTSTVAPLLTSGNLENIESISIDAAVEILQGMLPMMILFLLAFSAFSLFVFYSYRVIEYILIDRPGIKAIAALRGSRVLMKGNKFRMLRLDIHFWWYYLLLGLAGAVCYGDEILQLIGVTLPISDTACYWIFYGLYLVLEFGIYALFHEKVEVTYAVAYGAIAPRQASSGGVVLGNIFDMARQQDD